jgi:hypothetical protein
MVKCLGPFGCSHTYNYIEIVPPNLLSEEQKKQVLDKVMSLPEVRTNTGWKLDSLTIQPRADRWTGRVQLLIDGIKQLPPSQGCGWYGQVDVDLETLEILYISNIPPTSNVKCSVSSSHNNANTTQNITSVIVSTDKTSYASGEMVSISGRALPVDVSPLVIQVFTPDGHPYRFDQVYPAPDGSYSYSAKIGGKLGITGTYKVVATYYGHSAETAFYFTQSSRSTQ